MEDLHLEAVFKMEHFLEVSAPLRPWYVSSGEKICVCYSSHFDLTYQSLNAAILSRKCSFKKYVLSLRKSSIKDVNDQALWIFPEIIFTWFLLKLISRKNYICTYNYINIYLDQFAIEVCWSWPFSIDSKRWWGSRVLQFVTCIVILCVAHGWRRQVRRCVTS